MTNFGIIAFSPMALTPLILIHGYPFDHTMWKWVIKALQNKTKVTAPDLPGFGDNPVENAEPSLSENVRHRAPKRDTSADRLPGGLVSVRPRTLVAPETVVN